MLFRGYSQFIVEEVLKNLFNALEVNNNAALNRLLSDQQVLLCLRFLSDIAVLLVHAN